VPCTYFYHFQNAKTLNAKIISFWLHSSLIPELVFIDHFVLKQCQILDDRECTNFAWLWTRRFCMIANANILNDRQCKYPSWPWMQRFYLTVNAKILLDRECKDFAWRRMPCPAWQWMQRFTMTVNGKILLDGECEDSAWSRMQISYMNVNAKILHDGECQNLDERGWTWMNVDANIQWRWPYPISCLAPLVLFLPNTFKIFGVLIVWLLMYLVKVFPETRRAH